MNEAVERLAVWAWQNAAAASVLAALLLVPARTLRGRMAPLWLYAGGWLVTARLLLPQPICQPWAWDRAWGTADAPAVLTTIAGPETVLPAPPVRLPEDAPAPVTAVPAAAMPEPGPREFRPPADFLTARPNPTDPPPAEARPGNEPPAVSPITIAAWAWAAGAALCFFQYVRRHRRFVRRLASLAAVPPPDDLLRSAEQAAVLAGLRRVPELMILPGAGSPFLCGLVRPRIVLPSATLALLSPNELRHVLLHEMLHIVRRDLAANWLLAVVRALHWWNPLVHLTARRLLADRELLRDRQAVALLREPAEGSAYGHTLLKLATVHPAPALSPGLAPFFRTEKEIHRRLTMLQSPPRCSRPAAAGLTVMLAALALPVFSTVHGDDRPNAPLLPAPEPATPSGQNDPLIDFAGRGRISLAAPGPGSISVPAPGGTDGSVLSTGRTDGPITATLPRAGSLHLLHSRLTILRGLAGERLISVLRGLDEGGAVFAKLYPEYLQEKVELAAAERSGMGPAHPKVLALKESVTAKQRQLEAAAKQYVDLLELEWKGAAAVTADGARTVTTPHGPVQFTAPAAEPERAKALEQAIREIFNAPAAPSGAGAPGASVHSSPPAPVPASGPDELQRLRAEMAEMKAAIAELRSSAAAAGQLAELQSLRSQIQRNEARGLGHKHPENAGLAELMAEIEKQLETAPAAGPGPAAGLPFGIPETGREGMVRSPFAPEKGLVDVTGLTSGTIVQCPYTRNRFRVP